MNSENDLSKNARKESPSDRNKLWILILAIIPVIIIPILFQKYYQYPNSFSPGTRNTVNAGISVILFMFWIIVYRNTRPKGQNYYEQRNSIGKSILGLTLALSIGIVFLNYYLIATEDIADLSFLEYWTDNVLTRFDITMTQLLTDFGRFLSVILFQIIFTLVFVGIALRFSPKLQKKAYQNAQKKSIISGSIVLGWIILIEILVFLGLGYIWVSTEGRNYLLFGLYDQEYTLRFLPNLYFLIAGNAIYFRSRQYFYSDENESKDHKITGLFLILGLAIFNLIFSYSPIYPAFLYHEIAIPYLAFLLFNAMVCHGLILTLQAKHATMGGNPGPKLIRLSRLFWFIIIFAIIGYMAGFILDNISISVQLSQMIAYYPNLIFELPLTYCIYNLGLWLQQKYPASKSSSPSKIPSEDESKKKMTISDSKEAK